MNHKNGVQSPDLNPDMEFSCIFSKSFELKAEATFLKTFNPNMLGSVFFYRMFQELSVIDAILITLFFSLDSLMAFALYVIERRRN